MLSSKALWTQYLNIWRARVNIGILLESITGTALRKPHIHILPAISSETTWNLMLN